MCTSTAGASRRNLLMAVRYKYFLHPPVADRPNTTWVTCFSRTKSAYSVRHATRLQFGYLCAHVRGEIEIRCQGFLVRLIVILSKIHIHNVQFPAHGLCHASPARDQILRRRIGTDANRNPLAHRDTSAGFISLAVGFQALIHSLRDLAKRQTPATQSDFPDGRNYPAPGPPGQADKCHLGRIRLCNASGVRSDITTSFTRLSTQSGTVSRTVIPVRPCTVGVTLSRC